MAQGPDDVAAGLGDDLHAARQLRQGGAQRRAEAADVLHRLGIVDGKAAADVERVAGPEPLTARRRQEFRARLRGLDMLGGIGGLRAGVEGQPAHADAELGRQPRQRQHVLGVAAELARQVAHRPGTAERDAQQQLHLARVARELAHLVGIVGDEGAHAEVQRVGDIGRALDRVAVDAALRRHPEALHQRHFTARGQIEVAALGQQRLHHGRVRQRLQCVVQLHLRQRVLELAVLHAHPRAVEDQERRAELVHQAAHLGRLERVDEARAARRARPQGSMARVPV